MQVYKAKLVESNFEDLIMKKLPVGIQTFEEIINSGYIYVDKTQLIYNLASFGKPYFLSRPRRFGKSLLCSTLKSLFQGKKELFKGLWIEKSDWDWESYQVIHIDFSNIAAGKAKEFQKDLIWEINEQAKAYRIHIPDNISLSATVKFFIRELTKKGKIVLIIDEYDSPILQHVNRLEIAKEIREILSIFYKTIKSLEENFRFIFITGVTKFSKTSIFSGFNNITDLTVSPLYATILGYTQAELENNFSEQFDVFLSAAQNNPVMRPLFPIKPSKQDILDVFKTWYNGYCFYPEAEKVYNPFSVMIALVNRTIRNYWFESGTPTFLINLIKERDFPIVEFESAQLSDTDMGSFDICDIQLNTLLFQTGYLTITGYGEQAESYTLSYPNLEVRKSLTQHINKAMTGMQTTRYNEYIYKFKHALQKYDIDSFCKVLEQYFLEIPYTIRMQEEKFYQAIFFSTFKLVNENIDVEVPTDHGRIDVVINLDKHIYIIECKVDSTSELAIKQIEDMKYYEKYLHFNKPISLIGIAFTSKKTKENNGKSLQYKVKNII